MADNIFSPAEMASNVENAGVSKANKSTTQLFVQAVLAGIFIGIAFTFYVTVTTGNQENWGINRLIGGVCFSLGLILVVLYGCELFTSTLLTLVAWASQKISAIQLIRCWSIVFLGNAVGGIALALVMIFSKQYSLAEGGWGMSVISIAQHKLDHGAVAAVSLGTMCNLLVCLAVWISYGGRSLLEKSVLMILPVAMFVACGFEHCIANLFLLPLAIFMQQFAEPQFWQSVGVSRLSFEGLNWWNFISLNLIPVVLGNLIGAGIVAFSQWYLYFAKTDRPTKAPFKEPSSTKV